MNMVWAAALPGQSEHSGRNGHAQARPESRKRLSERHCPSGHNYDRYVRYVGPFAFAMRRAKQKPRLCTGRRFSAWVNRHRRRPPPAVCRPPAARRPPSAGCRPRAQWQPGLLTQGFSPGCPYGICLRKCRARSAGKKFMKKVREKLLVAGGFAPPTSVGRGNGRALA